MITMEMIGKIRRMHVRDKMSERAIAKGTGLSRNTVRKWLQAPENGKRSGNYSPCAKAGLVVV